MNNIIENYNNRNAWIKDNLKIIEENIETLDSGQLSELTKTYNKIYDYLILYWVGVNEYWNTRKTHTMSRNRAEKTKIVKILNDLRNDIIKVVGIIKELGEIHRIYVLQGTKIPTAVLEKIVKEYLFGKRKSRKSRKSRKRKSRRKSKSQK